MHKLLIADFNEDFRLALANVLKDRYHVLCCRSGKEALALLLREKPDILILDLMVPELDGITVLETAISKGVRPKVLASALLVTEYVLENAQRLGISYLMRRPCDIQAVAARVADLSRIAAPSTAAFDSRSFLLEQLHNFGFSTKHKGHRYLPDAVIQMSRDPAQSVTKELYPSVAKLHRCKPDHVERSIRNAIEAAWDRGDPNVWQQYFPGALVRPTNAVFITRMAEELLCHVE